MQTILAQYSEANNNMVELVIANNDDMALGAIAALQAAGYNNGTGKTIPVFGFEVPTELPGVDPAILDPRDTYANVADWEAKAADLAGRFVKNFAKYEGNEAGKALVAAGPKA